MMMAKTSIISSEHLARTNEPEDKQEISNSFGYISVALYLLFQSCMVFREE
jgi:hypothetical protein